MTVLVMPIEYRDRPEGSVSKLNTFSDGIIILGMIASLFKDCKPLGFFSILALICLIIGLAIGIPVIVEFSQTHLVPHLPSAILAVAFCGLAALLFVCGLILDTEVKGHRRDWELAVTEEYELENKIANERRTKAQDR